MTTRFFIVVLAAFVSSSIKPCHAQLQRIYGNGQNNSYRKVIPADASSYYAIGSEDNHGIVSRIMNNGQLLWTMKFDKPCVLTDAAPRFNVPGSTASLMVVGFTLPFDNTNRSLLIIVSPAGGLQFSAEYDLPWNEGFVSIAQKPSGNFAVTGFFNDPSFSNNVILLDVNQTGAVTSANMYGNTGDNGYFLDVEILGVNDYVVAGYDGNAGVIFRLDNSSTSPTFLAGVRDPSVLRYEDIALDGLDVIAAGPSITPGGKPLLRRFDFNLFPVWTVEVDGLDAIHQVETSPSNGDIYIVGTKIINGVERAVVVRIDDSSGIPITSGAWYLDNGETGHVSGYITILPNISGDIVFTDGKTGIPGSFGQTDAFLAVTDQNMTSYCTKNHSVTFMPDNPFLEGPQLDFMDFTTLDPVGVMDYDHIDWMQKGACLEICTDVCPKSISVAGATNPPAPCEAVVDNIGLRDIDGCTVSNVTYTITGATSGAGMDDASGNTFNQGISTVNYSYTDISNDTASCSFDVNVECGWITIGDIDGHILQCGADADFFKRLETPSQNRVPTIPVNSFPANAIVHCGKYDIYFEDLITPTEGYGDPFNNVGLARINTLCAVLTYVQSVLDYGNVPVGAPIRLYVGQSLSAGNPAPLGTNYLAQAGPFFSSSTSPRLINGFVFDYMQTGIDPASPDDYHAYVTTNFDQTFDINGNPVPLNWLNDYQQPMINCYYDLYSVLLHEIGHTLGWWSFIFYDINHYPASTLGNNQYSGLDYTYYSGQVPPFTVADKLVTGTTTAPQINPIFMNDPNSLDAIWTSPNAPPQNDPVYSGSTSLVNMGGWPIAAQSILSHLDEQMWLYSKRARISPGDVQNYVMGPFGVQGILRRTFTDAEINKLLELGYNINSGFASATLNNSPPYSIKMAGYNTIFNADFPDAIPADFTITNSGASSVTINLATDPMLTDAEGDPISVFPGSLTNIRGCGNGGNNHNQLTVVGQTITYTPRPDFYGRAQFGFNLFDGKEPGSYHIYTIDVLRGTNNLLSCSPGSNLILNGDCEEGSEVKVLGLHENIDASVIEESWLREGKMRQGIHFADAQPYGYLSNSWVPYGSGDKIKDSRINCNGTTYTASAGSYNTSIPGTFSPPNTNNGVGDRFKNLSNIYNYFNLCDDVQTCKRYILEFDYYATGNIPNGTVMPITIGFTNAATYPGAPNLTYSFVHNLTVVGISWQRESIPFTYCGTVPAAILNLQQNSIYWLGFSIDNLSLTEDLSTPPPLSVNITPANPTINAGSNVVLNANVANALCNVTYNWSPGSTASITVSPTVTTTYTLTVDDGCRSETASTTVNVAPAPCECAQPALVVTQSGQSFGLFCTQGAPTPVLPCPTDDVMVTGFFGCNDNNGDPCANTPVDWILTGPNGVISSGASPTNNLSLTFPKTDVDDPGTYFLFLSTLCNGAIDSCTCTVRWIREECDTCFCGTFSDMYFRFAKTIPRKQVFCDAPTEVLACPKPGNSLLFSGKFQCAGNNCPPTAPVTWYLVRLPNTPVASGTTTANPYFGINILPAWYGTPGNYELRLNGLCDLDTCECLIRFSTNCPDPCPCDLTNFTNAVTKGFANVNSGVSCKACFAPVALNGCDMVSWHIGSVNNPSLGMTTGNQTFCHTFSSSGFYTVFMVVTRKTINGTICATATVSRTISVACVPVGVCPNPVFSNPGFSEGAVTGVLGVAGASTNWTVGTGQPRVVEGSPGSLDAWTISLSGNFDATDALTSLEPICLDRGTGTVTIRAKADTGGDRDRPCDIMVIGFDPEVVTDLERAVARIPFSAFDSAEWVDIQIPFDLVNYLELDSCGNPMQGTWVRPVVFAANALGDEQGGDDTRSTVEVDYFCLDGQIFTAANDLKRIFNVRLYPNPTPGAFTLELPAPATPGTSFRISGLTGQTLLQQRAEAGNRQHLVNLSALPSGMYFVQVWQEGQIVGIGKLIKQ
jgi:hypothetical protein